jgi:tRNA nucleotidyltransferase (CCA-adding enzyme)
LAELRSRIEAERRARATLTVHDLALSGMDVMREMHWAPGPAVGAALDYLLDCVTETPDLNTHERLLELLRERER